MGGWVDGRRLLSHFVSFFMFLFWCGATHFFPQLILSGFFFETTHTSRKKIKSMILKDYSREKEKTTTPHVYV